MTVAAKWLRRAEIVLAIAGLSLLGGAFAATAQRWDYQARQERALLGAEAALDATMTEPAIARGSGGAVAPDPTASSVQDAQRPGLEEDASDDTGPKEELPGERDHSPPVRGVKRDSPSAVATLDPLVLGRIEIPGAGVRAIVREGADDETLDLAVGRIPGTARPGERGNTVLAGHRDTFFRGLRNVEVNDTVRLVVPPHTYEYRVTSTEVVAPDETRVLESSRSEKLTLITCYPFNYIGHAPNRFIVHAMRVE